MDVTADVVAPLQVVPGDMHRSALQAAMGPRNADPFRKAYLASTIEADYLEMTLPDTPRRTRQRYRLSPRPATTERAQRQAHQINV